MTLRLFLITITIMMIAVSQSLADDDDSNDSDDDDDTCQTGDDCERNECCLYPGVCRPMGTVNAGCDVRQQYARTKPVAMVTDFPMCPCKIGYFCARNSATQNSNVGICTSGK